QDIICGNDVDIDDSVWMGPQPSMKELGERVGVKETHPVADLKPYLHSVIKSGRKLHFLPPYRAEHFWTLQKLLGIIPDNAHNWVSEKLVEAVISLREIKEPCEIVEIEKAVDTTYDMQTVAMMMAHPGVCEQEICGAMVGITMAKGNLPSFPIILSMNGETLHNHHHHQILEAGRLMVSDAGAETITSYAGDITRTIPVGGKFSSIQKDVYNVVLAANMAALKAARPGIAYMEVHFLATQVLAEGLTRLGLMKGDPKEAVAQGAHALFMPHGLGHALGMDVHDMEGLGENLVGYDAYHQRSKIFGHKSLRMGKELKPGFVITDEPGCYFIPALIDQWRKEKLHTDFINYDAVEKMKGFGGIRIEDDILITETGCRVLGKPIPKTIEDIETLMASSKDKMAQAVKDNATVKLRYLCR
ncbi:MAG: M24 family metallopeptidase, partial [Bacteroidales bacterium]|nr:M24 family metallopeptidase [Bacteroidales bacterium]